MQDPTIDLVRALAAANRLTIPQERLELVRREYAGLLQTMERLNSLPLPMEMEPAFALLPPSQRGALPRLEK